MGLLETSTAASRGFDEGNYASAYVSEDFDTAWEQDEDEEFKDTDGENGALYRAGFIVGFFCSHEKHEVPSDALDELIAARATLGITEDCDEAAE